ncbi:hypothetical protein ACHHYP_05916 [Achlya hypogyna]|uniref:UDENN domain-containing protein n=1 Tax=Achlya hypogyna TaxID=1202772 RepID=A0A1V9YWM7_ACHHY|nr:hypothetical protein ACHHYP_05916 [Achlya hypogyna]
MDPDDDGKRSLFGGIRTRNTSPTKANRSPARNFRDMWGGTKPEKPKPARRQWFFDSDTAKEAPVEVAATPDPLAEDNSGVHALQTWCKCNDVPCPVEDAAATFDSIFDSMDAQDNQLTNELLALDAKSLRRRRTSSPRRPSTAAALPSPFLIRMPELVDSADATSDDQCSILDTVFIVGPDITDLLISPSLDAVFEPVVCGTYPRPATHESLQHFCFPNGIRLVDMDAVSEHLVEPSFFVFILSGGGDTGQDIHYASCLVRWLPLPRDFLVQPAERDTFAPVAYCVVSKLPLWAFNKPLLTHLHELHAQELNQAPHLWHDLASLATPKLAHALERKLRLLGSMMLPQAGYSLHINLFDQSLLLERPAYQRGWALPTVMATLSIETLLSGLSCLLVELKVVVVCDHMETLTATVLALASLLAPLTWAGPVVAVLPSILLEYLEAPVPYLIGVHELPNRFHSIPDLVVVYPLENCVVLSDTSSEPAPLPGEDTCAEELQPLVSSDAVMTPNQVELFAARVRMFVQRLIESEDEALDQVQATQMAQIFREKQRHSATRRLTVVSDSPPGRPSNQDDHDWSSLEVCTRGIMHLGSHGTYIMGPAESPAAKKTSALNRLRDLCAPAQPQHVTVVLDKVVTTSSPRAKPAVSKPAVSKPARPPSPVKDAYKRDATVAIKPDELTAIIPGVDIKSTPYFSTLNTLFTGLGDAALNESDEDIVENDLCITLHTSQNKALVFKAETSRDRANLLTGIQALHKIARESPQRLPSPKSRDGGDRVASQSFDAVDGEKLVLQRFLVDLKAGFLVLKVRNHGRQGAPHARILSCDPEVKIVSWRDPETNKRTRGWLSKKDAKKSILPVDTISDVARKEGRSPLRHLFYGSMERIAIVSSVKTLVVSMERPEDHVRLLQGFRLLIKYYGAHTVNEDRCSCFAQSRAQERCAKKPMDDNLYTLTFYRAFTCVLTWGRTGIPFSEFRFIRVCRGAYPDRMKRPAEEPLPGGWVEHLSKSKNKPFYVHTATGKTTWQRPASVASKAAKTTDPLAELPPTVVASVTRAFRVGAASKQRDGSFQVFQPWPHQVRAVAKLVCAVASAPHPGRNFLIQHSTGSGKSVTIACLAYQLLYALDAQAHGFHTIIILVDRIKLDQQLGDTVETFLHQNGVESIYRAESIEHLSTIVRKPEAQKVVVTTTHKLSQLVNDKVLRARLLHASAGISSNHFKHLAILADEAHRSHTSSTRVSIDTVLQALATESCQTMYVGFSATPSVRALELFGSPEAGGALAPFDTHSMADAIRQGHIVDVLRQTTFLQATAPASVLAKVKSMMHHFVRLKTKALYGKCLVVVRSRKDVVAYHQTIVSYMTSRAFDNTNEKQLNECSLALADVIVVCDKLDTGFNEPSLIAMYIDRPLQRHGHIVQLLSRLNRAREAKTRVHVVDYSNHPLQIHAAFAAYAHAKVLQITQSDRPHWRRSYDMARMMLMELLPGVVFTESTYRRASSPPTASRVVDRIVVLERDVASQIRVALATYLEATAALSTECPFLPAEWIEEVKGLLDRSGKVPANEVDESTTGDDVATFITVYSGALPFEAPGLPERYRHLSALLDGAKDTTATNETAKDALGEKIASVEATLGKM